MKVCTKCKETKAVAEFELTYNKKLPQQRRADCKSCRNKAQAILREPKRKEYNELQKDRRHGDPIRFMLYDAKRRAEKQGVPFDITAEDISLPELCPILGIKLQINLGCIKDSSYTLDKFCPELGYVKGNVEVISFLANTMKQNATSAQVQALADWMKQREDNHNDHKQQRRNSGD